MKTTFVSTSAMQNAVRLAIQRAQAEVTDRQQEVVTNRYADVGLALGSKSTRSISLNREVARIDAVLDTNALVGQRLSSSQVVLGQMSESAQQMLDTLITLSDGENESLVKVAQQTINGALGNFAALANTSNSGEYLFAGVNTDVRPMNDYFAPGSPAKAAFDDLFQNRFGFSQNDPQTETITAADLTDFLDTDVKAMFEGPEWNTNWSSASDTNLTNRINGSEVIQSSTNANNTGFRQFAMAAVVGSELVGGNWNSETRAALSDSVISMAGSAITSIDEQRAELGVAEMRVTKANVSLRTQKDIVAVYIGELEGVDPYEAATRMNTLLTQMEASYALTARIQQMSLLNFL
ncbi:flagellar hook-associated family protein [Rhizobium sp. EC-SD404]|uniref:flagellar hook-associated family protein n=1 Tax=Rhizobium sp. EC-SD404 TaxID=2038389 RepID=UPI0012529FE5|nr:flagellar hook-associated family protein [Rhizobium sp. EC-SD404]VVT32152.1 Flagellin [Rhizobium sp. EC-SD404]